MSKWQVLKDKRSKKQSRAYTLLCMYPAVESAALQPPFQLLEIFNLLLKHIQDIFICPQRNELQVLFKRFFDALLNLSDTIAFVSHVH
jgi:hypothetical protein